LPHADAARDRHVLKQALRHVRDVQMRASRDREAGLEGVAQHTHRHRRFEFIDPVVRHGPAGSRGVLNRPVGKRLSGRIVTLGIRSTIVDRSCVPVTRPDALEISAS
jgi:hypothetical protein